MIVKRSLTTMQITQFLVGASYAMIHSFISYSVPVATTVVRTATTSAAATTASSADIGFETPALLDNLRQLVLGVASKVTNAAGVNDEVSSPTEANVGPQFTTTEETVYELKVVPCIVTNGQTFAIWLNVLYLAPLTYLFVKFFITSYLRRSGVESARKGKGHRESQVAVAEKAGWDAARSIEAEVYGTNEHGSPVRDVNGVVNGKAMVNGSANGRVSKPVTKQNQRSRYA